MAGIRYWILAFCGFFSLYEPKAYPFRESSACRKSQFAKRIKFSPAFFKRRQGTWGQRPPSRAAAREILRLTKDQEGRQNSPVDCFAVGNPIKGFPKKISVCTNSCSRRLLGCKRPRDGFGSLLTFCGFWSVQTKRLPCVKGAGEAEAEPEGLLQGLDQQ